MTERAVDQRRWPAARRVRLETDSIFRECDLHGHAVIARPLVEDHDG